MATANDVLRIARAEIGYKESPSGSNKTKYGKEYGMNGVAWCAEFVWWVFKHANASKLFFGGGKCAYCPTIADYYIARKQTVSKSMGKGGDIVLFGFGHTNSQHIGIIEKKNPDGTYTCIEGNTSVGNNCNGGMVMRRVRSKSQINWIVRPKYDGKSEPYDYTLEVDGDWGYNTTITTQHIFKLKEDGNMGKNTWKAIQKRVGAKVDGIAGKETYTKMSKFLKINKQTKKTKTLVKAWQKWCNTQVK